MTISTISLLWESGFQIYDRGWIILSSLPTNIQADMSRPLSPSFPEGTRPCAVSSESRRWEVAGAGWPLQSPRALPGPAGSDLRCPWHWSFFTYLPTGFPSGPPCIQNSPFCWHELLGRRKFAGGSAWIFKFRSPRKHFKGLQIHFFITHALLKCTFSSQRL